MEINRENCILNILIGVPNTYKLVIYCKSFPTLKNSKLLRLNSRTKKLYIASSDDWLVWKEEVIIQINKWKQQIEYPLPFSRCSISIIIFFPNKRTHDIDGIATGIIDLLKTKRKKHKPTGIILETGTGVILDDDWNVDKMWITYCPKIWTYQYFAYLCFHSHRSNRISPLEG